MKPPSAAALHKPIAVFDAGIGSYAAVDLIHRTLPKQDIIYLADRASFPYGGKTRGELLETMRATLHYLAGFDPVAILLASNAPSITVLDEVKDDIAMPIFGVRPPVREALRRAGARDVAVLGVRSLVESPELLAYISAEAGDDAGRVHAVDASAMVELVESGQFLFDPQETRKQVGLFMQALCASHGSIGCFTLSSTHLPWLKNVFEQICPDRDFIDPLDEVVSAMAAVATEGSGTIRALVTESDAYDIGDFHRMLAKLGVTLDLHAVHIPASDRTDSPV